jgi:methionyl-tRNA formyltransferase
MIENVLELILANHTPHPIMQDDNLSCYAPMLKKEEGLINWEQSAEIIDRQIRALTPWPGCYTFDANGKRIKILSGEVISAQNSSAAGIVLTNDGDISCGSGIYRINLLQPENSKSMDLKSAINGKKISVGDKWGQV